MTTLVAKDVGLLREWRAGLSSGFVRNVLETYATRLLLIGLTLVTTIVVARLLGPEGRGLYAVAAAVGALGVQFGNLGLHPANAYFAARDPKLLPSLTGNSLLVSLAFGGTLSAILAVLFVFKPALISLRGPTMVLALLWVPLGLTYLLMQDLLLGMHDVRGYNLLDVLSKGIPLLLMGGIALLGQVSVATLFSTTVIAMAACSAWSLARLNAKCEELPRPSVKLLRESFQYALRAYLITLFCFLVLRADLFMVQHMLGSEQAGYYSIAASMADVVSVLAVVVGTILLPKLSALSDVKTKLHLTQKATWGIAIALFPVLAVASLLARPAIGLLFGEAFLPASTAFVLLMPGMLFLGMEAVAIQFLNSIGCPRVVVWSWGLCSLFNIVVNVWAIPRYGISGASVVSSISYFLAFCFVIWAIFRIARSLHAPLQMSI